MGSSEIPAWLEFAQVERRREVAPPALERLTLQELSALLERPLVLTEEVWGWSCALRGVELADNRMLISSFGKGLTPGLAAIDYAVALTGRKLVTGAYTSDRREYGPFATVAGATP